MVKTLAWIVGLYIILKAVRLALHSRGGYGGDEANIVDRLKSGEPTVILIAFALPVLFTVYSSWWTNRRLTRGYDHAATCFGQLASADLLPGFYKRFQRGAITESALDQYYTALDFGRQLGFKSREIQQLTDRRKTGYGRIYAHLAQTGSRRPIQTTFVGIDKCMRDDWPHDGLLDP